ncbi:GNAT family N-acetyltransferase [Sphingomonas panni]
MSNPPALGNAPTIITERLVLRRPAERDLPAIAAIAGDWQVARRLARVPHPYGLEDAHFFLDHIVANEWVWALTLPEADMLFGTIGLLPNETGNAAELGYWLAPATWGKGFATEAATAVIAFAFDTLGVSYLTSGHAEDNPASGRVLAKLGFRETERRMQPCMAAGTEVPSIRMSLEKRG